MNYHSLVYCFIFIMCLSCNSSQHYSLPDSLCYYKLSRVQEVYDTLDTEKFIGYKIIDSPYTLKERMVLIDVLKKNNKEFELGENGNIYISKSTIIDIENMLYINTELEKKMKDSTYSSN